MTLIIKFYKTISYTVAFVWAITGLIVVGSILHGSIGFMINIVMGIIFLLIGYYLYLRSKTIASLITRVDHFETPDKSLLQVTKRFFWQECVIVAISILIGLFCFSGAIYRAFTEMKPIFG